MSELPSGWADFEIGEIADVTAGGTPRANDSSNFAPPGEGIAWLTPADLSGYNRKEISRGSRDLSQKGYDSCSAKLIPKGSLLFSSRAPIGYVAVAANEVSTNQGFKNFTFPEGIDPSYAFYYLKSIREIAESLGTGTTFKEISGTTAKTLPFRLAPAREQTQIAQKLDELLTQIDTIKTRISAIPTLLKRFRQSVIAAAISGRLTEEWRVQNPSDETAEQQITVNEVLKQGKLKIRKADFSFERDDLYAIPECWGWIDNHRLAEDSSTAICAGPFGTIFKAKDFRTEGVPIIFLRHIGEGFYKTDKPGFMDESVWKKLHQEYSVYGGELLVTKLGDPPGTACLYPNGIGAAMVTPDVIKMNVDERVALPRYLMYFFNSPICKKLIEKLAFGATRLRIDIPMFKGFPIPLPPLKEQKEIVRRVEQLIAFSDQIADKVAAAQVHIEKLTQSTLGKAFRGELTADWRTANPDLISGNNSLDALLKSIKTAREENANKPKKCRLNTGKNTGRHMNKETITVTKALETAKKPLTGQQLMAAAGYASDSTTEQLESFFLDIRAALEQKSIVKVSRDENNQDWFILSDKK
ncbi:restriction endonuclease subunit S [Pseudomonas sp. B33.4]|uniref:restriction endonuclease subunit S n=1 Tax=Pseudomonas sp. B33.4 TaxID=3104265 RepID=UPI002ADEC479|nr:restriction endonuclease subunit S [Pseudomonas sp. B33.4]